MHTTGFRPTWQWQLRHFPGPSLTWMIGNAMEIEAAGWHKVAAKYTAKYGGVFKVRTQPALC